MAEITDTIALKDIVLIASPFIKGIVDTFVVPKLQSMKKRFGLDYNKYYIPTEEHFSEYLHRTYKRLSVVSTLVFNNSQRILKDIYIPLTISDKDRINKYKIEFYPNYLVEEFEKILITDTAGMGKSTMMKRIFLDIIDRKVGIPIFIELRRLSETKTLIKEIHEQINAIDKEFDEQLLLEFIREGGFIFFLDGYDEISLKDREIVTRDIQDFVVKASTNKFLLTSRPENALASFGDFKIFNIDPLKKKEAFELLRRYDKQGPVSSLLIKKLGESNLSSIEEFLTNPLLVSLLFTAFQYKQAIPFKKYLFYRQVYDANFESHDLTKGDSYTHDKYTELEVDDFHRVLRHIGFMCFKEQKMEFTKDEILKLITNSRNFCVGIYFKPSDLLNDLLITVPLFTQEGNYYRWAHKSLQEYFAAQFIYLDMGSKKVAFLKSLYYHKDFQRFINVLDLFFDMDYKTFRNVILYEYLKEFKEFYNQTLKKSWTDLAQKSIIERIEICFKNKYFIGPANKKSLANKDFNELFKKYAMDESAKQSYSSVTIGHFGGNLLFIHISETQNSLKSILARKNHNVLYKSKTSNSRKNISPLKIFLANPDSEAIEISVLVDNIFSSKEYFEQCNNILKLLGLGDLGINSSIALKIIKEIEKDLKSENDESLMFSF